MAARGAEGELPLYLSLFTLYPFKTESISFLFTVFVYLAIRYNNFAI